MSDIAGFVIGILGAASLGSLAMTPSDFQHAAQNLAGGTLLLLIFYGWLQRN